jgi:hypothetical protein
MYSHKVRKRHCVPQIPTSKQVLSQPHLGSPVRYERPSVPVGDTGSLIDGNHGVHGFLRCQLSCPVRRIALTLGIEVSESSELLLAHWLTYQQNITLASTSEVFLTFLGVKVTSVDNAWTDAHDEHSLFCILGAEFSDDHVASTFVNRVWRADCYFVPRHEVIISHARRNEDDLLAASLQDQRHEVVE